MMTKAGNRHRVIIERAIFRAALAISLLVGSGAVADLLVTRDGESMSGDVTRILSGILVFRTSLQGQMMIPMTEVRSLQTESRWITTLDGGTVHIGRFVADGVAVDVASNLAGKFVPISYGSVISSKQAPPNAAPPQTGESWPEARAWRQEAGVGIQSHFGSRDITAPYLYWEGEHALVDNSLGLRLRFDVPDGGGEPDFLRSDFQWDLGAAGRIAPFVRAEVGRNRYESLDWRTGLTVGLRYAASSDEERRTTAYVGLAAYYSRWRDYDSLTRWDGPRRTVDAGALRMHLGLKRTQNFLGEGRFESRLTMLPGISSIGKLRAEAGTALTYPLTPRLHLRLDMLISYEEDSAFGTLEALGTTLGASVQFDF